MSKLRKSAQGRECQIRIPGVCNGNPETTVLAHLNGAGMGRKHDDMFGAFACSNCHNCVDGREYEDAYKGGPMTKMDRTYYHLEGIIRTQQIWLDLGLIEIK